MPAGPTLVDEVANAAFWLGLMNGFGDEYNDITRLMDFDDAKSNYFATARDGMETELSWIGGRKIGVSELIKKELLPLARQDLQKSNVDKKDIDRYLGIIEERNETRQNVANWLLASFSKLCKEAGREEVFIALTSAMVANQKKKLPVHKWRLAELSDIGHWIPTNLIVEEFMDTDLFTVHKDDIVELVADIMEWQKLRYVLVEDGKGKLEGLVSNGMLLRHFRHQMDVKNPGKTIVSEIMVKEPVTIGPGANIKEAMVLMKNNRIGCLPVVKKDRLVGVITGINFRRIAGSLLNLILNKENI